ncbi:MAG: hypothetical protein ABS99_03535, partial [Acetobacteraceae bacterium SCN 69-10]
WRGQEAEAEASVVAMSRQLRAEQKKLRRSLLAVIRGAGVLVWLTAPVIYSLIVPLMLTDLFVTLYQAICFPVYGIPKVRRSDYVVIDRHRLGYLNAIEKLNCVYCGYSNGVLAYASELASRTEQHFCPIKHATPVAGAHRRYARFAAYADAQGYRDRVDHPDQPPGTP